MNIATFTKQQSIQARIGFACLLTAIMLLASGRTFAQSVSEGETQYSYASYMFSLVNEDRHKHGSAQLEENPKLDHLAQVYANYLLKTGFFGHVDPYGRSPQDRAALFGIRTGVSENLAWESSNYEVAPQLIQRAENSMMNEATNQLNHRYNILNPDSKYIGIGVARAGDKILMVQEFSGHEP